MGVLPTTERGRSTRRRIVAAAREVVAEKGAAGASLDEVGALAPASRSQLYHYFDDKDDLIRAVAEATNDIVLDGQRDFFAGLNTWDGLVRWTDFLVAIQEQRHGQGGCPIATLLGQLAEQHDDIRVVLSSGFVWLATSTLASLEGGLVLTQARRDPQALRSALDGALALIATYRPTA